MRRNFVHSRSVRIDGSRPDGKIPLRRNPTISVREVFELANVEVSIPLNAVRLKPSALMEPPATRLLPALPPALRAVGLY